MIHPTVPSWYAAYTRSRAEKKVANELQKQGIKHYLPLYKTIRQWSDRKKKVELPLIRSYIFIYITKKEYLAVLQTSGIVNIVSFNGTPVPIPDWQIDNLKIMLGAETQIDSQANGYEKGKEVQIIMGPLQGLRGIIIQLNGQHKLIVGVNAINYFFTINVNPSLIKIL